jgi:diguanylate cyclase (GGDEF)-like protein
MLSDRLRLAMAATRRSGRYGALLFLGLDNFKSINDAHGHGVGDLLLQDAARRIAECVREIDTVARFGGDEFVVLLNQLDPLEDQSAAQACMVAEKIRTRLAQPYAISVRRELGREARVEAQCSSSIGLVLLKSFKDSEDELLKHAGMALHQAKNQGRNRVQRYDPNAVAPDIGRRE